MVEDGLAFAGLLAFSVVILALAAGLEHRLPRLPTLERLGDASYSIYLAHIFAVGAVAGLTLRLVDSSEPWIVGAILALAVGAGIAAGLILYRLVEEPMMRRLKRRG